MTEIYAEMSCRGDELMTAAKYDEALAVFTQCSLTGGLSMEDTGSILTKLGACNCLKGDVAEAMKYLMGAVQISPKNVDAYYYLADAYRQAGIFDIALDTCERGLAVSPNHKGLEELSWKIEKCIKGEVE